MKKLILLTLLVPLMALGQSYPDFMSPTNLPDQTIPTLMMSYVPYDSTVTISSGYVETHNLDSILVYFGVSDTIDAEIYLVRYSFPSIVLSTDSVYAIALNPNPAGSMAYDSLVITSASWTKFSVSGLRVKIDCEETLGTTTNGTDGEKYRYLWMKVIPYPTVY